MKKLFAFYVLLATINVWSQSPYQEFQFVNIKEGISKVGVTTIAQDHYGFIWIGTSSTGLYKFDGIQYTSYTHKLRDSTSLSSSRVLCSFLDSRNRLWIGTENGLNLYDKNLNQFKRVVIDQTDNNNGYILAIEEDSSNNLLVGTLGLGLFKLNLDTFSSIKVSGSAITENAVQININSIQHSKYGKTYVGTNLGLKEIDIINNRLIKSRLLLKEKEYLNVPIQEIFFDSNSDLWIGSQNNEGVFKCIISNDEDGNIQEVKQFDFTSKKVMDFAQLSNGTMIIGTENDGLFHVNTNGDVIKNYVSNSTEENSILHNSIWTLFIDKNERIWMGYYNSGVAVSDNLYDKFSNIKSIPNNDNSLKIGSVMAMVKDNSDNLWVATDGGGIDIYNQKNAKITHINNQDDSMYSGLTSDYIEALLIDSKRNIWAGSWDNGLYFLKKGEKSFVNYNIDNTSGGLKSNTIISMSEDSNGIIWIGTFYQGLHSYNPKTKVFKKHDSDLTKNNGLSSIDIRKVMVDSEDEIWLGTTIGLFKVEKSLDEILNITFLGDQMTKEFNNPSNANHILSIYEASNKDIWIGTRGAGLCRYSKSRDEFHWFNKFTGLTEENVAAVIEEDNENLWVSGNSGITKINLNTLNFTNYTINDGLLSNDFNFGSVLKDKEGIIYFGNFKGVDYFQPNQIKINTSAPSLCLTDFKIFNKKVIPSQGDSPLKQVISETDSISLTSKQSVFTIEYSGINYTRPEKNEYAYFLKGYEKDYNYVGDLRTATYTNLDAGHYTFMLKAANNDGIWNETPLQLKITVLPPWWKTAWAISLYIALFLLGVLLLNKMTQNRIKEKELINNERNKRQQEKDLNEKKFQFFTNISHEFRTPLTLIKNPLEDIIKDTSLNLPTHVKRKHNIIHKNTDRIYRLINELLDFRKLELNKLRIKAREINLVSFTKNVTNHFKEEAFTRNIQLSIDADVSHLPVWADEGMLEKIIFNILSNAIKVTPDGGIINVDLISKEELVMLPLINNSKPTQIIELAISDTGPGMNQDEVKNIFERFYQIENLNKTYYGGTGIGLEVVQNFVHLHRGKVEVKSALGKGTTFRILLPVGKSHFKDSELLSETVEVSEQKDYFVRSNIEIENIESSIEEASEHTLLIVEDNAELRNYIKDEFKSTYKVLIAKNGKEGIEVAKASLPDIIITDVLMPEMDGFAFCKNIKSDLYTSHIPLLMLTAKTRIDDRMEGIEHGADAYMVKPFDLRLLKLRVSQLITSRQVIFNKYFSVISDVPENIKTTSLDKEFIDKVLNFINDNIGDPDLSVELLASEMNLSRSQFYRKIKALTNQTANEFLRNIRLQKAKQIIEMGNTNISEVCYNIGFSSPSYFSKCFKSYFGMLPTEVETSDT